MDSLLATNRIKKHNQIEFDFADKDTERPIIYWANRELRATSNWALTYAYELAIKFKQPLIVVYNLVPNYLGGIGRQWQFKMAALSELEADLAKLNIPIVITLEKTSDGISELEQWLAKHKVGAVVTDFNPLKISQSWVNQLREKLTVPFFEVDAHNIVPCWFVSQKQEFGAYTLRPKINKLLPDFLASCPELKPLPKSNFLEKFNSIDWSKLNIKVEDPLFASDLKPGRKAGLDQLNLFCSQRLKNYAIERNDPNKIAVSDLSPYLHYGTISALEIFHAVQNFAQPELADDVASFIEELVVRRELADNYCYYNSNYDNFAGFPNWAQKTLQEHADDKREFVYSLKQFEEAKTHDELWNAAQNELLIRGKLHGYMRMYWAKKILEWTENVEEAQKIAIYLNDKYELDGRDPNGYTGIAWSMGGVHDRAWFERPIYGKIRYMNANGAKKKFNTNEYISRWNGFK